MSRLFYLLEDHFDALAQTRRGSVFGRMSDSLCRACAAAGDALKSAVPRRF